MTLWHVNLIMRVHAYAYSYRCRIIYDERHALYVVVKFASYYYASLIPRPSRGPGDIDEAVIMHA